ncbi:MAG: hypothetical protein ACTSRS_15550 [Candidatus Helarchaeota archaeon]
MTDVSSLGLGITIALLGAFINNFGIVLQKRQVNLKAPPDQQEKSILDIGMFLKDPIWVIGILMQTFLYLPFLLVALDLIGITLTSPLSNAGIIFLVLGLIFLIKERLHGILEYSGLLVLIVGVITISLGEVTGTISITSFLEGLQNFWIIFTLLLILTLVALALILFLKSPTRLIFYGIFIGNCYAFVAIALQWFIMGLTETYHPLGSSLLIIGIVGAVIASIFGIVATQEAYKRGQAIRIVPFTQITINLFPILAGVSVFQQTIGNPLLFWIGTISIIVGASLLARFEG